MPEQLDAARAQLGRVGGSRWGWVLQIKFPCHPPFSLSLVDDSSVVFSVDSVVGDWSLVGLVLKTSDTNRCSVLGDGVGVKNQ